MTRYTTEQRDLMIREFNLARIDLKQMIYHSRINEYINLIMAVLISIGLIIFLVIKNSFSVSFSNIEEMFINTLPRFLITISSLFIAKTFIKQYNKSKKNSKYYQNELTNKQLKFYSITTAIEFGNIDQVKMISNSLFNEDRNFISKKEKKQDYENEVKLKIT